MPIVFDFVAQQARVTLVTPDTVEVELESGNSAVLGSLVDVTPGTLLTVVHGRRAGHAVWTLVAVLQDGTRLVHADDAFNRDIILASLDMDDAAAVFDHQLAAFLARLASPKI